MLQTNPKTCKTCNARKRIYRETWCRFWRQSEYYCTERQEIVTAEFSCKQWRGKRQEYDFSAERLLKIEADLKALLEQIK